MKQFKNLDELFEDLKKLNQDKEVKAIYFKVISEQDKKRIIKND